MRRRIFSSIGIIGGVLTAASVLWEYARMSPAYRFLVDPWSIRGFETVHGAIAVAIGLALAALAAVTRSPKSVEPQPAATTVVASVIVATVIAFAFDPGTDVGFNAFLAIVFGLLLALISMRVRIHDAVY